MLQQTNYCTIVQQKSKYELDWAGAMGKETNLLLFVKCNYWHDLLCLQPKPVRSRDVWIQENDLRAIFETAVIFSEVAVKGN